MANCHLFKVLRMEINRAEIERHRERMYRINYILTMLNNADSEAAVMLEKKCRKYMIGLSDSAVIYNIMDSGRKKSGESFSESNIAAALDVCLQSAEISGIPAVELAKRIVSNLFGVEITRQELDTIESETRNKRP